MKNLIKRFFSVKPRKGSVVSISGQVFEGDCIGIHGDDIVVDGNVVGRCEGKSISVAIDGDVDDLTVASGEVHAHNINKLNSSSGRVTCNNVFEGIRTGSGDIECQDVSGDVNTSSGDVQCNNIDGSVKTASGDVKATTINGSVETLSGDIRSR